MQEEHYRGIAHTLKKRREEAYEETELYVAVMVVAFDLMEFFTKENPFFSREQFLVDCGLENLVEEDRRRRGLSK